MKRIVLLIFYLIFSSNAFCQSPFELRSEYYGHYDFTMIGASLNKVENTPLNCSQLNYLLPPVAQLDLAPDQNIIAATLYWSANTITGFDEEVRLNNQLVQSEKTFVRHFDLGNRFYTFYSCKSDVTEYVQAQGNGSYTLTELTIDRTKNCTVSYGGWALLVVFEDENLNFNTVKIYDGWQGISGSSPPITISISGLSIDEPLGSYLGMLSWEGDSSLAVEESVHFNNHLLSNDANPSNNLFNSTNSFTGDVVNNMDMDRFDIAQYVQRGDTTASFTVGSGQDLVMMNMIAFTLKTDLPNPGLHFLPANVNCAREEIELIWRATNYASSDTLFAGSPISIYQSEDKVNPIFQLETTKDLAPGQFEEFRRKLPFAISASNEAQFYGEINLDAQGQPITYEFDISDNTDSLIISWPVFDPIPIADKEGCIASNQSDAFVIKELKQDLELKHLDYAFDFYRSLEDSEQQLNKIEDTVAFLMQEQTIYCRENEYGSACYALVPFKLIGHKSPDTEFITQRACAQENNTTATFDLSTIKAEWENAQPVTAQFFTSLQQAIEQKAPLDNLLLNSAGQTLYYRLNALDSDCFAMDSITLQVIPRVDLPNDLTPLKQCVPQGELGIFDLTDIEQQIPLVNADNTSLTYYEDAALTQSVSQVEDYQAKENQQQLYIKISPKDQEACYQIVAFRLLSLPIPESKDVPLRMTTCADVKEAEFNLDHLIPEITGNNHQYVVEFYEDEQLSQKITTTTHYLSAERTIYTKLIHRESQCESYGQINLQVDYLPEHQTYFFESCAIDENNMATSIDLTAYAQSIKEGNEAIEIQFYLTENGAKEELASDRINIQKPFISQNNTIFIHLATKNTTTDCSDVAPLNIEVLPLPAIQEKTVIECSEAAQAAFDLDKLKQDYNSTNSFEIKIYKTEQAAVEAMPESELRGIYSSTDATLFVKALSSRSGCSLIKPLHLVVDQLPLLENELTYSDCLKNGLVTIDFALLPSKILDVPDNAYSLQFFASQKDADLGQNAIHSARLTEDSLFYIKISSLYSNCYLIKPLFIAMDEVPEMDLGIRSFCLEKGFLLPDGRIVYEPGHYDFIYQPEPSACDQYVQVSLQPKEIYFPNAFSPNNDGINDLFRALPEIDCIMNLSYYSLQIFNRWGQLVFETDDYDTGWNGQFNGELAPLDVYVWHAEYEYQGERKEQSGNLHLLE